MTIIRVKGSTSNGDPAILGNREIAYSAADHNVVVGGGRLYIGVGAETGGDAAEHIAIGGLFYTEKMEHTAGVLTADAAVIVDGDSKINQWLVGDVTINGTTVTGLAEPTADTEAATKLYVDTALGDIQANRISGIGTEVIANDDSTIDVFIDSSLAATFTATGLTVTGDFAVQGTNTVIDSTTLTVNDLNIVVADGAADSLAADGAGLTIDGAGQSLTWDHSNSRFALSAPLEATGFVGNVTGDVSGNAGTATLATDATSVTVTANNTTNENVYLAFVDGATGSQGIETDTALSYNPSTDTLTAVTFSGALTGNASTATTLETARTIGGVSFDGSTNINLPGVNIAGNQDTSGNAATATVATTANAWTTTRNISLTGDVTGTTTINGSGDISIASTLVPVPLATENFVATASQTVFAVTGGYTTGAVEVFLNGIRLIESDFTDTSGTNIVLATGADADDILTVVKYGVAYSVTDHYTKAEVDAIALDATNVTVIANNTTNETCYPLFVDGATGAQQPESDTGFTYNPNTGTLTSTVFAGEASTALYADLAEKYTSDPVAPGTVMQVGSDPRVEIEPYTDADIVAGVISTDPAYLMNEGIDGEPLALVGRVPVRVVGPVTKGHPVYAVSGGVASKMNDGPLVGIALETNSSEEEKLVECMLKV